MATPIVPPRHQQRAQPEAPTAPQAIPQIPARPSRRTDPSPARDMARSPLNELPSSMSNGGHNFYGDSSLSVSDLPKRKPSVVALPSVGQEGNEYDSYDQLPAEAHADVPLLAPTASVPTSTAKSRISAVTSSEGQASGEESEPLRRTISREQYAPLRAKASFSRSQQNLHSSNTPRPASVHSQDGFEHGIPVIGQTVPMYPNAGDVQAPSPAPGQSMFPPGIGFFNDGTGRAHQRRRSSRQEFGPPGSYGLHGHPGQQPSDQFEREWVAKHPDIAAREGYNVYGGLEPRPASALTSEQLNRLVGESDDVAFGANRKMIGTPDQEIGYLASEMYSAHVTSAKPSPADLESRGQASRPESAQKASFPFKQGVTTESEDENTFHVDGPEIRKSKITGGTEADGAIDLGPKSGNTAEAGGWFDERGYGIPILASDQISKRPGSAYLQPAINPEVRDDDDYPSRPNSAQYSRPSSRTGNTLGHHQFSNQLARFISHEEHHASSGGGTPLEEIEEYEPLFPEEDGKNVASLIKEKLKQRPGLAAHHFPSQDVWEDTPESLQFTADVDTPEPERVPAAAVFETPEQEQARRAQNPHGMTSDAKTFAKPHFRGAQQEFERPGIQRFPSQDIWEDTPNSMYLETTVSGPQEDEVLSPPEERPTTNALPSSQDDANARATTGLTQLMNQPQIPSRPVSRSKLSQDITSDMASDDRGAEVPDLGEASSKPAVPARPAKFSKPEHGDQPGAKPVVPARPAGNKLAGLRANFMNDLNSRLQLGPQAPPARSIEPESEEEKAPLADARKSRVKGPARRKPATSAPESFGFSFSSMTLWHIDEEDELKIGVNDRVKAEAAKEMDSHVAANLEKSPPPLQAESGYTAEAIGHPGDMPDPTVEPAIVSEARAIQPELEKALAQAEPAPVSAEALHAKDATHAVHDSGRVATEAGTFEVPATEQGNVAYRDGEEVGRTD